MILDLFKISELTSISRQVLNANKELIGTALNTSRSLLIQGIDYNLTVFKNGTNLVTSTRKEVNRVVDTVCEQSSHAQQRSLDVLDSTTDSTTARVSKTFKHLNSPIETLTDSINTTVLDQVSTIAEPSLDLLKKANEQLTEVPKKLIKTASLAQENVTAAVKEPMIKARAVVKKKTASKTQPVAKESPKQQTQLAKAKPVKAKLVKAPAVTKTKQTAKTPVTKTQPVVKTKAGVTQKPPGDAKPDAKTTATKPAKTTGVNHAVEAATKPNVAPLGIKLKSVASNKTEPDDK